MTEPRSLELAERVAETARGLNIETALIGASALAIHGYVRGTSDIDFAAAVDPYRELRPLEDALRAAGLRTKLNLPDEADRLGGVLRIWTEEDADGEPIEPIDVVNLQNPLRPLLLPAHELIRDAIPIAERPALRYVRLPHLILLKLYAGGRRDLADVVELLARNPDADVEEIRALCKRYALDEIDTLIEEAAERGGARR
jgi:hypothetical protein